MNKLQTLLFLCLVLGLNFSAQANIIGADDRVPMLSETMPWAAIGRIQIGEQGICTGTLVARNIILTAAHCLIDGDDGPLHHEQTDVTFLPNFKQGRAQHQARITQVWLGTPRPRVEPWDDYAFARIDQPLGDLYGTVDISSYDGSLLTEFGPKHVSLAGYSGDFLQAQTAGVHMNCSLRDLIQDDETIKILAHDCDMRPGASGGPMLAFTGHQAVIVGVNIAEKNYMTAVSRLLGRPLDYSTRTSANIAVTTDRLMGLYRLITQSIRPYRR